VLFTPGQPFKGVDAIKPFFQLFLAEFAKPGASFSMREQWVEGDYAYILWGAEKADNSYAEVVEFFRLYYGPTNRVFACWTKSARNWWRCGRPTIVEGMSSLWSHLSIWK